MRFRLLLLPFIISSCITKDVLYGNSTVTTVTDTVFNYNGEIVLDLDVVVPIDSGEAAVSLTIDENLRKYISIDTTDSIISIYRNDSYDLRMSDLQLAITVPNLEKITCKQGTVTSSVPLLEQVVLTLSGNAQYTGKINTRTAEISIMDSASVSLSGPITESSLTIKSSAEQDLAMLELYKTEIDISTEVTSHLTILNHISGILNGPGDIQLLTRPPFVYVKETGTGTVNFPVEEDISTER